MVSPVANPLLVLREYLQLAPWSLRDLAMVVASILEASAVRPVSAVASMHPNERTVRFYVTRGLVAPPEGRGTSATYSYRHLLQVLSIKLRQMEGATLETITREHSELTGDLLERRVAAALGSALPTPSGLKVRLQDPPRGRTARVFRDRVAFQGAEGERPGHDQGPWHRLTLEPGLELHVHDAHPLATRRDDPDEVGRALLHVLGRQGKHHEGGA